MPGKVVEVRRLRLNGADGKGVELYYNFQVNRWLNVTPDLQYVRPEATAIATDAFIYGVRANVSW